MVRTSIQLALCLELLVMLLLATAPVSAQVNGPLLPKPETGTSSVSYTVYDPVTEQMVNQCNGETVDLTGGMVYQYHMETRKDGDYHLVINASTKLTGTGESTQAKYVCTDTFKTDLKVDYPNPNNPNEVTAQAYKENDKLKLVAQGPTPDMTITYTLHWSISDTGVYVWKEKPSLTKCTR